MVLGLTYQQITFAWLVRLITVKTRVYFFFVANKYSTTAGPDLTLPISQS